MGRTSNFSFPIPGRKPATNNTPKLQAAQAAPPPRRPQPLSKAQRILGTSGDLNIDSPRTDNVSWQSFRPRSSGMSIAISETTEEDDTYASNAESWDADDRIHPPVRLNGKASSTLLGHSYRGDADNNDTSRRMRPEKSSSTLRSYYDRATTPLSVSQQTSASSARDLALRKGVPPAVASPGYPQVKKKTSRLDISRLFHKKSKDGPGERTPTPSIMSGGPERKLTKLPAKPKQRSSVATPIDRLLDEKTVQFQNSQLQNREESRVNDLYEHYENRAFRSPAPPPVHVPRAAEKPKPAPIKINNINTHTKPQKSPSSTLHSNISNCEQPPAWKTTSRAEVGRPPWDAGSVNSDSSKATRTSRKSVFSSSNLQQNSILSFSSEDESDTNNDDGAPHKSSGGGDIDLSKFPRPSTSCAPRARAPHHAYHRPAPAAHQRKRSSSTNTPTSPTQNDNFLTIPLPSPISPRLSGPWQLQQQQLQQLQQQQQQAARHPTSHSTATAAASTRSASPSRSTFSARSARSADAASVPRTPRSSRLMAVTPQEQALLSALRTKRARMRDEILAEHVHAAPPSPPAATTRGKQQRQQRALLHLDRRGSQGEGVDRAEPSPDLSDFLSFGSDEDAESTPRSSWLPRVGEEEEGRFEGGGRRFDRSTARLSAVGKAMPIPPSSVRGGEVRVLRDEDEEVGVWGM